MARSSLQNLTDLRPAKPYYRLTPFREVIPAPFLTTITPRDADGFVTWMRTEKRHGLATVARRIKACRFIFNRAVRWEIVDLNPFDGIKAGASINHARKAFIPLEDIEKIITATSDLEFRAVLALSRLGALRCPSEVLLLRWVDVRWEDGRLIVRSPKTEGRTGGESRIVPLFPRLHDVLLDLYESLPEGAGEFVISKTRDVGVNWRTRLKRLIAQLGIKPWPKLFHNLRASRESELCAEYSLATVCQWLGHRPEVAAAHYLVDPDKDASFQRAIGKAGRVTRKATRQGEELGEFEGILGTEETQKPPETLEFAGVYEDVDCARQESNLQPSDP